MSLAGAQGGLWSVEGGNKKVCEGLLASSTPTVHKQTKITEIQKVVQTAESRPKYFLKGEGEIPSDAFDAVIVAAPLEVPENYVKCVGCAVWPEQESLGTFWPTVAAFVKGEVNLSHFRFSSPEQVPEVILTTENDENFFNSIGYQEPVTAQDRREEDPTQRIAVRKVFSRSVLASPQLDELFSSREETKVVPWLAYPLYAPPEGFLPFVLDEGVFYVNAIEYAASAIEMSAIAGNNVALLAHRYLAGAGNPGAGDSQAKTRDEL